VRVRGAQRRAAVQDGRCERSGLGGKKVEEPTQTAVTAAVRDRRNGPPPHPPAAQHLAAPANQQRSPRRWQWAVAERGREVGRADSSGSRGASPLGRRQPCSKKGATAAKTETLRVAAVPPAQGMVSEAWVGGHEVE